MIRWSSWCLAVVALAPASLTLLGSGEARAEALARTQTEQLWLHRNLGAAYAEAGSFAEAAVELAAAAGLAPESAADAHNAGVVALAAGDTATARPFLETARSLDPGNASTAYALGILEKQVGNLAEAAVMLRLCGELGGAGPELAYNRGLVAVRQRDPETARADFREVLRMTREHAPRHYLPALFRYGRTLLQLGEQDLGAKALEEYRELASSTAEPILPEGELERGPLLDLAPLERPADVRTAGPLPAFRTESLPVAADTRWADAADLDGDGDTDLLAGNGQTVRDLRRDGEEWLDVTASRGLAGLLGVTMARALDLDGDGQTDLVRAGGGGLHAHPGRAGGWDPPERLTGEGVARFAPLDLDLDGDVDLVAVGAAGPILLRNVGGRPFEDATPGSGLDVVGPAVTVVPADLDDDGRADLVFVTRRGEVVVASSRGGTRFDVSAPLSAIPSGAFDLAVADLDADGRLDLAAATPGGVFLAHNEGALAFAAVPGDPALAGPLAWPAAGGESLWIADLDNDGWPDLLGARETGASLGVNRGGLAFAETDAPLQPVAAAGVRPVAVLALDGDGRTDLVIAGDSGGWARNIGATGSSVVVRLRGTSSNREGVGAVVELLAGSRYVRADGDGRPVHLGLGDSERIDVLRVRWPTGLRQTVAGASPGTAIEVKEESPPDATCPFVFTWNGTGNELVTSVLAPAQLGRPDPLLPSPGHGEVVHVSGERMQPDAEGYLVVHVTDEGPQVTYLDQVLLYAVDHPEATAIRPGAKTGFDVLDGAFPPALAVDHRGRDVTEKLLFVDEAVVGDLGPSPYEGLTEPHTLLLDFGQVPPSAPLRLHLAGWRRRTSSSVDVAVAQDPRWALVPPRIEVSRVDGSWEDWPVALGLPGDRTRSIPVDLDGAFPGGHARVRVTSSLELYWDRALLQAGKPGVEPRVTELSPDEASLRFRGHSTPLPRASTEEPWRLAFDKLRPDPVPWDQTPGRYTRYGDVSPLVQDADDRYVVLGSGDECTLRWRADALPALPPGYRRTFLLAFDGWVKDADPNTAEGGRVEPWPFHGMSAYPYPAGESYPSDLEHQAYLDGWNTRAAAPLGRDLVEAARQRVAPPPSPAESGGTP